MMKTFEESFLEDVIKRLKIYKDLGDKTLSQLNDEDVVYRANPETNSVAMIVHHMQGNMLSRFTHFLTEDGEKPWRQRDAEFDDIQVSKQQVIAMWNEGWQCVLQTVQQLQPGDVMKTIYIRTEPLLVYDALLRQFAHYPYHVGQIIQIAKERKGSEWQSLSIAKGQSNTYNEQLAKQLKG